jgi:hypothetical protein
MTTEEDQLMFLAVASLALIGAVVGTLFGLASRALAVEPASLEQQILELLPGLRCGHCGFVTCGQAAAALATGSAPVTVCRSGGEAVARAVSAKLGLSPARVPMAMALPAELSGPEVGSADLDVALPSLGGTCRHCTRHSTNLIRTARARQQPRRRSGTQSRRP